VQLNGELNGTADTVAFTLPEGYRPPQDIVVVAITYPLTGFTELRVSVGSNGEVKPNNDGAGTLAVLDNIRFPID
jgi:hypothetical protein